MIRALPAAEFESHVVLPGPSPLAAEFGAAGARLHVVPMRRLTLSGRLAYRIAYALAWPVVVARVARVARQVRADVVHTNSLHSLYGWAVARLIRRPHVWHAREIVVQSGPALRIERFLARRFADVVVAMSSAIAEQLEPDNVRVIIDSVDTDVFGPQRAGRFRANEGIADEVPLCGFAGRVDTWKGLDVLLDAFPLVREQRPDAELVIAGATVLGKEGFATGLRARARAMPGVRWLGPRDDVPDMLADLDVFVLPSTSPEPFGMALVEALTSGVPSVATDAGGPREIAARVGDALQLVPASDPAALAEAVASRLPLTSSAATRRARPPRWTAPAADYAGLFRDVSKHDRSATPLHRRRAV
jgi:glycosyltransferase involved in cell wall biosynthesis